MKIKMTMRNIKLFEEYKEDLHYDVQTYSKMTTPESVGGKLLKLSSFFSDLVNYNFSLIPHRMKNKTGYNKLSELISELDILTMILERTNGEIDFEDMYKYGLRDEVLLYIEHDDVKEYLERDKKTFNKLYTHEYLDIFHSYADWKRKNGLSKTNESHNLYKFKTINYCSCGECGELFKTKGSYDTCPKCSSSNVSTMNEVDWYKQID